MRTIQLFIAGATICGLASSATAQPGPPPPPPGYGGSGYYASPPVRSGFTIGFGFGFGVMEDDTGPIDCYDCGHDPLAGAFDLHVGGMLNPRTALVGELWGHGVALDSSGASALVQTMVMIGLQYWVTPQLWLKGGIGFANLQVSYDDGYHSDSQDIDTGGAIMGAIGYEVLHSQTFAIDLQLRLGSGGYDGIDEQISVGTIGVGFNWY